MLEWIHSPYSFREKINFLRYRITHPKVREKFSDIDDVSQIVLGTSAVDYRIGFLGDLLPIGQRRLTFDTELTQQLSQLDLVVVNLEGVISTKKRFLALAHSKDIIDALQNLFRCPVAINVANNHAGDFGKDDFEHAITLLSRHFPIIGNQEAPLEIDDQFSFFASTHWSNQPDCPTPMFSSTTLDRLQSFIKPNRYNIFLPHWGYEMQLSPTLRQRDMGHRILQLGWDAIVGNHPHVPQPLEIVENKKPIAYSLGNLCYQNSNPNHHLGRLIVFGFSKQPPRPQLVEISSSYTQYLLGKYDVRVTTTDRLDYHSLRKSLRSRGMQYWLDLLK